MIPSTAPKIKIFGHFGLFGQPLSALQSALTRVIDNLFDAGAGWMIDLQEEGDAMKSSLKSPACFILSSLFLTSCVQPSSYYEDNVRLEQDAYMKAYYPERLDEIISNEPLPPLALENREQRSSPMAYRQEARASLNPAGVMHGGDDLPSAGQPIAVTGTVVRAPRAVASGDRSAVIQGGNRYYDLSDSSLRRELAQNVGKRILVEGRVASAGHTLVVIDAALYTFNPDARKRVRLPPATP